MLELVRFHGPAQAPPGVLDQLPWEHRTAVRRAGRAAVQVRSTRLPFGRHLEQVLSGLPPTDAAPTRSYSVVQGVNGIDSWWSVYDGDRRISESDAPSIALTHLIGAVNDAVIDAAPHDAVPLHAAACAWRGRAVLVAGPSEAGKSTLAAGLGRAGLTYLTDEVAVVDPRTLEVAPYAKPLSIDPGAWPVLPELRPPVRPEDAEALRDVAATQWHVDPSRLAGGVAGTPLPVGVVLRTRYTPGAGVRLREVRAGEVLVDLALDMFRPRALLRHQVETLAALLDRAVVRDLVYDDLPAAAETVRGLLEGAQEQ